MSAASAWKSRKIRIGRLPHAAALAADLPAAVAGQALSPNRRSTCSARPSSRQSACVFIAIPSTGCADLPDALIPTWLSFQRGPYSTVTAFAASGDASRAGIAITPFCRNLEVLLPAIWGAGDERGRGPSRSRLVAIGDAPRPLPSPVSVAPTVVCAPPRSSSSRRQARSRGRPRKIQFRGADRQTGIVLR